MAEYQKSLKVRSATSKRREYEADLKSVEYLNDLGIFTTGFIEFFYRVNKLLPPNYISLTHPAPLDRLYQIKKSMESSVDKPFIDVYHRSFSHLKAMSPSKTKESPL